jgi:hypothetical protein
MVKSMALPRSGSTVGRRSWREGARRPGSRCSATLPASTSTKPTRRVPPHRESGPSRRSPAELQIEPMAQDVPVEDERFPVEMLQPQVRDLRLEADAATDGAPGRAVPPGDSTAHHRSHVAKLARDDEGAAVQGTGANSPSSAGARKVVGPVLVPHVASARGGGGAESRLSSPSLPHSCGRSPPGVGFPRLDTRRRSAHAFGRSVFRSRAGRGDRL